MPKWLDELEATPEEEPLSKKLLAGGLVVVALGVVGYMALGRGPAPPPPPPSTDVYRAAFPQVASARYDDSVLALEVQTGWASLDEGTRTEHLVGLLEITGSFEFTSIQVKDTAGTLVATVDPDGAITWHK